MKKSENKPKISSEQKGFLIILSAPSGCGKTTVMNRLFNRHPDWIRSISMTTRKPRTEEKSGRDYEFVTEREFILLRQKGELMEWAEIFGQFYGTPKKEIEDATQEGKLVVLTIDIRGARSIRKILKNKIPFLSVFILPPSIPVLRERLEKRRTDSQEDIEKRIQRAEEEIKAAKEYDAAVINHDLNETVHEIEGLISQFQSKLAVESLK